MSHLVLGTSIFFLLFRRVLRGRKELRGVGIWTSSLEDNGEIGK